MIKPPVAVGLTICDQVIVAEKTRHLTLVNCYLTLKVRAFPARTERLFVVAILTDGLGAGDFSLVVERLDTADEIYRLHHREMFADSLQHRRFVYQLKDCTFPAPGRYQLTLFADGNLIALQAFEVLPR